MSEHNDLRSKLMPLPTLPRKTKNYVLNSVKIPALNQGLENNLFHSHVTMVTCPHLGIKRTTCFTHISPWLPVHTWASKDNLFHSHVTMVTCPHLGIKRTTRFTHISPWLPVHTWASKYNLFHSYVTIVTCPHLGIKGQPALCPSHHGYLSSPGHQRRTWTQGCSRVPRGHQSVYSPRWPARSGCRCLGDRG